MSTDLPILSMQQQHYSGLVDQTAPNRPLFNSAVQVRFPNDSGHLLPSVKTAHYSKRNSEGQILQVKFAPEVTFTPADIHTKNAHEEKVHTILPESVLKVEHQHYEQWARVPGRRGPNSSLLRGIQALKARMKRDSIDHERLDTGNGQRPDFHINALTKNTLMTRDKLSEDGNGFFRRRERSCVRLPKPPAEPRSALKANAQVIDAGMFKSDELSEHGKGLEDKPERISPREAQKPRIGVARIRDRCALPVSVYQPISIGDHVFLVNEPLRYNEYVNLKTRSEGKMKKEPKPVTAKQSTQQEAEPENVPTKPTNAYPIDRSKTYTSGFPIANTCSSKRPRVNVSSAELFDFSQLTEIRHSMDGKLFERSRTDLSFNTKDSKSSKLVPNVRRLKEWIKS